MKLNSHALFEETFTGSHFTCLNFNFIIFFIFWSLQIVELKAVSNPVLSRQSWPLESWPISREIPDYSSDFAFDLIRLDSIRFDLI